MSEFQWLRTRRRYEAFLILLALPPIFIFIMVLTRPEPPKVDLPLEVSQDLGILGFRNGSILSG